MMKLESKTIMFGLMENGCYLNMNIKKMNWYIILIPILKIMLITKYLSELRIWWEIELKKYLIFIENSYLSIKSLRIPITKSTSFFVLYLEKENLSDGLLRSLSLKISERTCEPLLLPD